MRRNIRLIYFVFGMLLLITGLLLCIHKYISTDDKSDYMNESIEYWNDIMKENESEISYIIQWINNNKNILSIYKGDGNVYYEKKDKYLTNLDSRITEFVKENGIDIVNSEKDDGNVICFTHVFFEKKRVMGNYVLIYFKDEKAAQDSYYAVRDSYYKIKNGYYCYVTFYE